MIGPSATFDVRKFGATGDGTTDDYAALQAAIDAAEALATPCMIFLPRGRYRCNTRLVLAGDYITMLGHGAAIVQGAALGTGDGACLLYITGNHCTVDSIEFDGNISGAYTGSKNRCVQINGTTDGTGQNNTLRQLYCHDTYNDPANPQAADTIQIINGVDNTVEFCTSLRSGWNGIRVSGDGNRVHHNWVIDYLGRGIRFNGGDSGWVTDNTVRTESISSGAALLTDPETSQFGSWYCERNRVYCKSERVFDVGGTGTNALKVARTKYAMIRDNTIEIGLDSYSTGTFTYDHTGGANERQVTLTGGTWPAYAKSPARFFYSGAFYNVSSRISDSIITLSGSGIGSDVASASDYYLEQIYDNVGIRLEDGNDHVEIEGGQCDQILMTNGIMSGPITAHADNGAGKVRFTQTAHGQVAGDDGRVVYVAGSTVLQYNTKHAFTYVNANTWDSDVTYVAGTIGPAFAHGATDILRVRGVHFGFGKQTSIVAMENIKARVCDIEKCVFDLRYNEALNDADTAFDPTNRAGATVGIDWEMPDDCYDLLRLVDNDAIFGNDGATARLITPGNTTTGLILAGKTIGYGNRVRNLGAGGSALVVLTTGNVSRAQLFNTAGEQPTVFRGTAAPTAGTWAVGHTVWNSAPAVGQPIGWVCSAAGTPGTWTAMANL